MSGCSLHALSMLHLDIFLSASHEQYFWHVLCSLPALSSLTLNLKLEGNNQNQIASGTLLPHIVIERLESLRIDTMARSQAGGLKPETYPKAFIGSQPALIEFNVNAKDVFQRNYDVTSPTIKALRVWLHPDHLPRSHSGEEFSSLKILRIGTGREEIKDGWKAFIRELPWLQCIEISQSVVLDYDGNGYKNLIGNDFLSGIREDLIEYRVLYRYHKLTRPRSPYFTYSQEAAASTRHLVSPFS